MKNIKNKLFTSLIVFTISSVSYAELSTLPFDLTNPDATPVVDINKQATKTQKVVDSAVKNNTQPFVLKIKPNYKTNSASFTENLVEDLKNSLTIKNNRSKKSGDDASSIINAVKNESKTKKKTVVTKTASMTSGQVSQSKNSSSIGGFCARTIAKYTKDQLEGVISLDITDGKHIFLPISRDSLSRIETPFKNVNAYSNSKSVRTLRKGKDKNILMVSVINKSAVSSTFLQDDFGNIANLTFVPCNIPPQNIVLTLDRSSMKGANIDPLKPRNKALKWEMSNSYVKTIGSIMNSVAQGKIPNGYEYQDIKNSKVGTVCKTEGLVGRMEQVIEGSKMRVGVFLVGNTLRNGRIIDINESSCYVEDVLAVSAWPNTRLSPGEFTEIYVLFKKKPKASLVKRSRRVLVQQ